MDLQNNTTMSTFLPVTFCDSETGEQGGVGCSAWGPPPSPGLPTTPPVSRDI